MTFLLTFKTTLIATFQIFLLASVGYILVKKNIMDEKGLSLLTKLLINLFLPCFSFYQLTTNFSFSAYPDWWLFPLICWALMAGGMLLSFLLISGPKFKSSKREFISLVSFQNSGFIPLLLVTTMFSAAVAQTLYIYIFLFLIGFDLVIWSLGVWFLSRHRFDQFELKSLLSTPFVAIVTSLIVVALGLNHHIPQPVLKPLKLLGDCALPMAMIVVGGNLGFLKVSNIAKSDVGLVVFAKLIFLPFIALMTILTFKIGGLLGFFIMLQACVPSATSLSVIARHYDIEEKLINPGVFFTHVASVLTMPVFLTIYMQFSKLF